MGILFLFFQGVEYSHTTFSIADRVYGSVFFVATGFHGLHVLVGTVFLIVCAIRIWEGHFLVKEKRIFYIIYKLKVSPIKGTFCYLSGGQIVGYEAAI